MLMRLLRKLTWILMLPFPVNPKKVLVINFYGRGYGDNPKAVVESLRRRKTELTILWAVKGQAEAASLPEGVVPCPIKSLSFVYHQATAGIWIDNSRRFFAYKKKSQRYLQLWHGFPLKRIEKDVADKLDDHYVRGAIKDSAAIDLLVSDSEHSTRIYRQCFWYDGRIEQWGAPRNDVILKGDPDCHRRVREHFQLAREKKLLLYAPTFRADHSTEAYSLDAEAVRAALCRVLGGEWSVLVRLHPAITEKSASLFCYDGIKIVDATAYPDMQELLCAADAVISDYSSLMFDFALSGKPCLQFATDIGAYMGDRNFYLPLNELPFPLAESNEELLEKIEHFDLISYREKLDAFYRNSGFERDGNASERCADWVMENSI